MEDSLHMTCYNCGNDGSGIVLSYGRLLMVKERKTPKIIIQDDTIWLSIDQVVQMKIKIIFGTLIGLHYFCIIHNHL